MTQIQKIQLSRINPFLTSILIVVHLIPLFFIFKNTFIFVFLLYLVFIASLFLVHKKNKKIKNLLEIKKQDILEKSNLIHESLRKQELLATSFEKKNIRYSALRQALDKFNQSLKLEEVVQTITNETFELFGRDVTVIMYLINEENSNLEILFSKKIDPQLIIKEKNGDLFDEWVLRHNQCLLVENSNSDFRFEPERIKSEITRTVRSVIICPLVTINRFLGILRIESPQEGKFSTEDLRFLSTISNLAAISLENSSLYEHTQDLAIKDGLTGLYLRRYLDERGQAQIDYCHRQKCELSVLMVDIDHFKKFNDKFGHHTGDIILTHIADLLKGIFHSENHIVCRFGGEEFAILMLKTNKQEAIKIAENLRRGIQDGVIFLRRSPLKITVSIGVATYPRDANSWTDLIKAADAAMYQAKQQGRNKVC